MDACTTCIQTDEYESVGLELVAALDAETTAQHQAEQATEAVEVSLEAEL